MATSSTVFPFEDKVVIVTGGNNGIGLETATQFLHAGAKVAVLDIRPFQDPPPNQKRLEIICDVGDEQQAEAAVAQVLEHWGTIDILCNVAGVMDGMNRVSELDLKMWDRCFRVNVTGPMLLMRACTRYWLTKPKTEPVTTRGSIVNVSSTAAKSGAHAGAAYTASKHAMLGLTRSTAYMYAKEGIRCNTVLPGGVHTNIMAHAGITMEQLYAEPGMAAVGPVHQLQLGRIEAADVARTILFAAGNEGMNGAELIVDKGWSTI